MDSATVRSRGSRTGQVHLGRAQRKERSALEPQRAGGCVLRDQSRLNCGFRIGSAVGSRGRGGRLVLCQECADNPKNCGEEGNPSSRRISAASRGLRFLSFFLHRWWFAGSGSCVRRGTQTSRSRGKRLGMNPHLSLLNRLFAPMSFQLRQFRGVAQSLKMTRQKRPR